jgi:hypothetical protein
MKPKGKHPDKALTAVNRRRLSAAYQLPPLSPISRRNIVNKPKPLRSGNDAARMLIG